MALATQNGGQHDTEWPPLAASHGMEPTTPTAAAESDNDWELLSTTAEQSASFEVVGEPRGASEGQEMLVVSPHPLLMRQRSHSFPDVRELEEMAKAAEEESEDEAFLGSQEEASRGGDSSVVVVPTPVAGADTESISSSVVVVSKPKVSFRDAMLASHKHHGAHHPQNHNALPKAKNKVKSRYVVTPIKRCSKSTGDLLSLVRDDEDEEAFGHSDAVEFYNRKAHGARGHVTGLKLRPDEAKRKQMILQKKDAQRKNQG